MPGPLAPALIAGATALIGGGINAAAQGKMNKKTMRWNEKMYKLQRGHSLEDRTHMEIYNSPVEMMRRFKEAGLNPNLIYGSTTAGGETQMARGANVEGWNPKAPQVDVSGVGTGIQMYYDLELKRQALRNMAAEEKLKEARVLDTLTGNERKKWDMARSMGLFEFDLTAADLRNKKTIADIGSVLQNTLATKQGMTVELRRDEREALQNASNLREAAARILVMRSGMQVNQTTIKKMEAEMQLLGIDTMIRDIELSERREGIHSNDKPIARGIIKLLNEMKRRWGSKSQK